MTAKRFGFGVMLPDLRVLLLATITTFLLATGAGLYASVRLLPEPLTTAHADRDTPISRVALSWQDLNQPAKREFIPAAIRRDAPGDVTPTAAPADGTALSPGDRAQPATGGDVAVKTEGPAAAAPAPAEQAKDDPVTTGAIMPPPNAPDAAPSAITSAGQSKVAARPDPAEAANYLPPPPDRADTPVRAEPKKAKPAPQPRRNRIVRRADPNEVAPASSADNNAASFFTEFGSRLNR